MPSDTETVPVPKLTRWIGYGMSALPVLLLVFSASMKLAGPASLAEGFNHLGYSVKLAPILGIVEITCTILYVIPRCSVLGAILLTGYLGGATATHARIGESAFVMPVLLGVLVWGGLYLRDPRIRELIPFRKR